MKRSLIIAGIILAIIITAIPAQAEIPADKQYIIKMAAYSLAMDIRNEDSAYANHYERVMLANRVLNSPGTMSNKIAEIAEAAQWGSVVDWPNISNNDIKNAMSAVWDHVALATYGSEIVRPE